MDGVRDGLPLMYVGSWSVGRKLLYHGFRLRSKHAELKCPVSKSGLDDHGNIVSQTSPLSFPLCFSILAKGPCSWLAGGLAG